MTRNYKITTTADIDNMLRLYRDGLTLAEIARRLGCSCSTVTYYVYNRIPDAERRTPGNRAGSHRKHRWATTADVDNMLQLYRDGWSMAEIARRLGYHFNTIRRHIRIHVPKTERRWPTKHGRTWRME